MTDMQPKMLAMPEDVLPAPGVNRRLPSGLELTVPQSQALYAMLRGASLVQAAKVAGVAYKTASSWRVMASWQEAMQVNARGAFREAELNVSVVLAELWAIMQVTMQDLFDDEGRPIPVHRLPRHVAGAVREYEAQIVEDVLPDGTVRVTRSAKAKLLSRQTAIERLGEYLRMWSGDAPGASSAGGVQFIIEGLGNGNAQDNGAAERGEQATAGEAGGGDVP